MKVFKFNKYKDGYDDRKRGATPMYGEPEPERCSGARVLCCGDVNLSPHSVKRRCSPDDWSPPQMLTAGTSNHGVTERVNLPTLSSEVKERQNECLRVFSDLPLYNSGVTPFE